MDEPFLFGAIADDFTGGSDLAGMLSAHGVPTVQVLGLQPASFIAALTGRYRAAVISLKSRSIPPPEARDLSLQALDRLRLLRARQIQFKYCSTFDSTRAGNIGPVTEALMDEMGADFTVAVPALPVNGRTQYMGHLFVGTDLLSETHMRQHPVTPMTDANLVRHLQSQMAKKVGLISHRAVSRGSRRILDEVKTLKAQGVAVALVDAVSDRDLEEIASAVIDFPFVTGGSGLGMVLPSLWAERGWLRPGKRSDRRPPPPPPARQVLVVAGSCSEMTLKQLERLRESGTVGERLDMNGLWPDGRARIVENLRARLEKELKHRGLALFYTSAAPAERAELERAATGHGVSAVEVRREIELMTGELVKTLVDAGLVSGLILAGGETTGAVLEALRIPALEVGETLEPGVPVCRALGERPLTLALKSGNFGSPDFFVKAVRHLKGE